jgi:hypothetical protein
MFASVPAKECSKRGIADRKYLIAETKVLNLRVDIEIAAGHGRGEAEARTEKMDGSYPKPPWEC